MGLSQEHSDSECGALTHFSVSLAHGNINIKEPYNQDIREQITTTFLTKDRLEIPKST